MEIFTEKMVNQIKIIEKLLNQLEKDLNHLNKPSKLDNVSELVERVGKITTVLKTTLDLEKGGDIAKNLLHLYNHIQYAAQRIKEHEDYSAVKSAHKVVKEINEGWSKLSTAAA